MIHTPTTDTYCCEKCGGVVVTGAELRRGVSPSKAVEEHARVCGLVEVDPLMAAFVAEWAKGAKRGEGGQDVEGG